jgi:hypothetical protein
MRSIPVSGPGSAQATPESAEGGVISEVLMATMKQKIGEALETEQVRVVDAYGDGRHVTIDVVSKAFEGKGAVARQRLVYKVRWGRSAGLMRTRAGALGCGPLLCPGAAAAAGRRRRQPAAVASTAREAAGHGQLAHLLPPRLPAGHLVRAGQRGARSGRADHQDAGGGG